MIDYAIYGDTDSIYIGLEKFIKDQGLFDEFNSLTEDEKIEFINKLQEPIKNYINKRSLEETQQLHYNSSVDDFSINFETEKICESGL